MVGAQRPDGAEQAALSSQDLLESLVRPVRVCTHNLELVEQSGLEKSELLRLERPGPAEELPAAEKVLFFQEHIERGRDLQEDVVERPLFKRHLKSTANFQNASQSLAGHRVQAFPAPLRGPSRVLCLHQRGTDREGPVGGEEVQLAVRKALHVPFSAEVERPSVFRDHSHRGVQRQRPRACVHLVAGLLGLLGSRDHLVGESVRCFLLRVLLDLYLVGRGFQLEAGLRLCRGLRRQRGLCCRGELRHLLARGLGRALLRVLDGGGGHLLRLRGGCSRHDAREDLFLAAFLQLLTQSREKLGSQSPPEQSPVLAHRSLVLSRLQKSFVVCRVGLEPQMLPTESRGQPQEEAVVQRQEKLLLDAVRDVQRVIGGLFRRSRRVIAPLDQVRDGLDVGRELEVRRLRDTVFGEPAVAVGEPTLWDSFGSHSQRHVLRPGLLADLHQSSVAGAVDQEPVPDGGREHEVLLGLPLLQSTLGRDGAEDDVLVGNLRAKGEIPIVTLLTKEKKLHYVLIKSGLEETLVLLSPEGPLLGQGSEECLERVSKVGVSHLEVVRQLAEDLDRGLVHDLLRLLDFRGEDGREGVSDVEGARLFRALALHHPVEEHTVHVRGWLLHDVDLRELLRVERPQFHGPLKRPAFLAREVHNLSVPHTVPLHRDVAAFRVQVREAAVLPREH